MIHAYNELYLTDAKNSLSVFFDYAINDCKYSPDWFASLFVTSGYAKLFEEGNPTYISGMSGIELAQIVIKKVYGDNVELPEPTLPEECSPEYWAGWALAEYQWYSCHRFKEIFNRIPFSDIIAMYPLYHEMDISSFIQQMDTLYSSKNFEPNLKKYRKNMGISQAELSKLSGINLRNIQMYEQQVISIDNAKVNILYKLARVLHCNIEDLLEYPMK